MIEIVFLSWKRIFFKLISRSQIYEKKSMTKKVKRQQGCEHLHITYVKYNFRTKVQCNMKTGFFQSSYLYYRRKKFLYLRFKRLLNLKNSFCN